MRTLLLFALSVALFVNVGCQQEEAPAPPPIASPRGGISLYPLSTPPPAAFTPPAQQAPTQYAAASPGYVTPYTPVIQGSTAPVYGATYTSTSTTYSGSYEYGAGQVYTAPTPASTYVTAPTPAYCPPAYCPDPLTPTYTPTTVVIPDPPVVIDNVYYPSNPTPQPYVPPASNYPAPGAVASPPAGRASSPYDPVFGAPSYTATTTYAATTYTSPTYATTTYAAPATYATTTYSAPAATYAAPTVTTTYTAGSPQLSTTTTYPASPLVPTYGSPATVAAMTAPLASDVQTYRLVPASDIPPGIHPNDAGPSQWFEILRPGNGPIRIGRVSATCVCVGVRVPNRFVQAGERALIEARTLTRPPARNLTYGIYVNVEEPEKLVLDTDVTLP